eukprot:XP_011425455.1 PREDICTED: kielin/chordin-like protein [Crassostrea gigas]
MEGKLLLVLLFVATVAASGKYRPQYPGHSQVCTYEGKTYNVGQKFPAGDDCNTCTCKSRGRVSCSKKTCFCDYNGQKYKVGQKFPAGDGCNQCSCKSNGRVSCTEKACIKYCDHNGQKYKVGQKFPKGDGCNTCRCKSNGTVSCSSKYCPPPPSYN